MFIDTHAHIHRKEYDNIDAVIKSAKEKGIIKIINCADNLNTSKEVIKLSNIYEGFLFSAIGIHPNYANEYKESDIEKLEKLLKENKIVAIGEIGLDYYHDSYNKNRQIELLKSQLELAVKYNLPIIIHSREATQDTINTLKEYNLKGIIHCFTGSLEVANIYIKMGYLLGIGGVITFKNSKLYEVVDKISLKNIVFETDCPYLTPEPYRKYKNEPKYLIEIAKYVSDLKNISTDKLCEITNENICKIFDF
jgi:TatD DNase family protein